MNIRIDPVEHIIFLDSGSLKAEIRKPKFEHVWKNFPTTKPDQVPERLAPATIAITNKVLVRADALARAKSLKLIVVAATGTDIVDLAACRSRNVVVQNIRNYANASLPEHVFALVLALRRNLFAYRADIDAGRWQRSEHFCFLDHPIGDLAGSTLGVVGFGALGKAVAALGVAFGMRVLAFDMQPVSGPEVEAASFDQILEASDVISLHVPLNPGTKSLIGAAELARMKPNCLLINTARGGLVDEEALADALRAGRIGAGFDVLSVEPPRAGNPLLELNLPNFVLTPHVAWASAQAMQALADQLVDNLESFVRGEPQNVVT
jgi:glycerate dehydrogenase